MLHDVNMIPIVPGCEESLAVCRDSYGAPPSDIQLGHNTFQAAASEALQKNTGVTSSVRYCYLDWYHLDPPPQHIIYSL